MCGIDLGVWRVQAFDVIDGIGRVVCQFQLFAILVLNN